MQPPDPDHQQAASTARYPLSKQPGPLHPGGWRRGAAAEGRGRVMHVVWMWAWMAMDGDGDVFVLAYVSAWVGKVHASCAIELVQDR